MDAEEYDFIFELIVTSRNKTNPNVPSAFTGGI